MKKIINRLSILLGFEISNEMVNHIYNLKTEQETKNYFEELLDKNDPKHQQFIKDIINKKFPKQTQNNKKKGENKGKEKNENNTLDSKAVFPSKNEKLSDLEKEYQFPKTKTNLSSNIEQKNGENLKNNENEKSKKSKRNRNKKKNDEESNEQQVPSSVNEYEKDIVEYYHEKNKEGKTQYERFAKCSFQPFEYDLRLPVLPGRRFCDCFGRNHDIVSNCLGCGRITCVQEGSGPCLFCGELVISKEEKEIIFSANQASEKLMKKLLNQPKPVGWEIALERSKNLLDADATKNEKLTIIDDQLDYYQMKTDWNQLIEKGETFVEQNDKNSSISLNHGIIYDDEYRLNQVEEYEIYEIGKISKDLEQFLATMDVLKNLKLREKSIFHDPRVITSEELELLRENFDLDKEFWELNDVSDPYGICLTIRQPYASLIISGIKKCEVREWATNYRGALWIVSSSYQPTKDEILQVEQFYKHFYNDENLKFPKSYAVGRLLGRVDLTRVYDDKEYIEYVPNGEAEPELNHFYFILENPIPLKLIFPLKGCKKLYLLPKKLHTVAGLLIRQLIQEKPELVED